MKIVCTMTQGPLSASATIGRYGRSTASWFDEQVVLRPATQTIRQIRYERNVEVKRIRIERFGRDCYSTRVVAGSQSTTAGTMLRPLRRH